MEPHRAERVAEALREELSEIVEYEMSDPRLGGVAVAGVHVSRDMRHARIRVGIRGDERRQQEALKALEGARHYIRREVGARLRLFRIPELHFELYTEGGPEDRVEELLRRIRKEPRR